MNNLDKLKLQIEISKKELDNNFSEKQFDHLLKLQLHLLKLQLNK
jgi:hypothetical protein